MAEQLIAIFCDIEDFCKEYETYFTTHLLMDRNHVVPRTSISLSEIMTIVGCFHLSQYRNWEVLEYLTREMYGKLFADRGYLSEKLFEKLWERKIQLITKLKKNMKNKLMDYTDKLILPTS